MRDYAPEYSQAALDALLTASNRRRAQARIAVERLCRRRPDRGDFMVRDADGRTWSVTLFDGVVLTYWIDQAVCEIKIGLIEWV
jgi:hypothetical protein